MLIVIVTSMSHTTNAIAFKEDQRRNTRVWHLWSQWPSPPLLKTHSISELDAGTLRARRWYDLSSCCRCCHQNKKSFCQSIDMYVLIYDVMLVPNSFDFLMGGGSQLVVNVDNKFTNSISKQNWSTKFVHTSTRATSTSTLRVQVREICTWVVLKYKYRVLRLWSWLTALYFFVYFCISEKN